jgi:hypothetical protein
MGKYLEGGQGSQRAVEPRSSSSSSSGGPMFSTLPLFPDSPKTGYPDKFLELFFNTSGKIPAYCLLLGHDRTKYPSIRRYIILATENIIKS